MCACKTDVVKSAIVSVKMCGECDGMVCVKASVHLSVVCCRT